MGYLLIYGVWCNQFDGYLFIVLSCLDESNQQQLFTSTQCAISRCLLYVHNTRLSISHTIFKHCNVYGARAVLGD